MEDMGHRDDRNAGHLWKWALIGSVTVIAYLLWTEHQPHVLGALPLLLLLACPLMHLFHRHGDRGHAGHHSARLPPGTPAEPPRSDSRS